MRGRVTLAVGLIGVLSAAVSAQTQTQTTTPSSQSTTSTTAAPAAQQVVFASLSGYSNDYQVGPGDLLEIQIVGHTDLTQKLRVSSVGEISHPLLGLVKVGDMTAFDVEDAISTRLRDKGHIQEAQVLVSISEYQAKPVYVSGAVLNAGEFVMSQELTVADAILLAGGLNLNAANEGYLHRRVSGRGDVVAASFAVNPEATRPGFETIKIDLEPMKEGRFDQGKLPLKRGDVLVVPQMLMHPFYVVGDVVTPRDYSFPAKQKLMASQAISWAGGPLPTAKMSNGLLVRYDALGNRIDRKVDYAAILDGRQEDFAIQPGDVVFIPGSKVKSIAQGMLELTSTMVMSASFRVARSYQMPDAPDRPTAPTP